jgi:hypothetical protein
VLHLKVARDGHTRMVDVTLGTRPL